MAPNKVDQEHHQMLHSLAPRVSILEKGQEAIQQDLLNLSTAVKEQGVQLTNAITKLSDNHNSTYNALADKISNINKTDWQGFWTMVTVIVMLVAAVLAPVWMNFNNQANLIYDNSKRIEKMEDRYIENVREHAKFSAYLEVLMNEKNISKP